MNAQEARAEGRILIVDDEKLTRATLQVQLADEGFEVHTATNGFEALEVLAAHDIDVVVTDLRMPSMDGLELLQNVQKRWPDTAVVFITAFGTVASAVDAMHGGAADYLTKPLNAEELVIRVRRLIERRRDLDEIRELHARASRSRAVGDLVYRSRSMAAVVERALSVADAGVTVLIEGETGTGKAVFARLIHDNSPRSARPFVTVNCAELNPNLVESELFGHEAGAFTGATRQRRGRFESAFGGTLLIDEVDDLPREIQVRLLRFLQDHTFERVGSSRTMRGDVRVLCATKQNLAELVKADRFRADLYYRIDTVALKIPPLRERKEDVVPLAEHFARKASAARGAEKAPELLAETLQALLAHDWPGNVRELEHAVEHAVTLSRGGPIGPAHLPEQLQPKSAPKLVTLHVEAADSVSYSEVMTTCERDLLDWALSRTGGNQVKAAELLQMSRTTLRGRLASVRGSQSGSTAGSAGSRSVEDVTPPAGPEAVTEDGHDDPRG